MKTRMGVKDYDFLFKLVLLGDTGVGKTTLLRTYTERRFNTTVRPHDVADVETKTITRGSKTVKLYVWDTAGLERYQSLTESYYRNAKACLIMFDVSNEQSFYNAAKWLADALHHCPPKTYMILVGTKCNEPNRERQVSASRAQAFALEKDLPYMEVGSQQNHNVEKLFETVADAILADLKKIARERYQQRMNLSLQSGSGKHKELFSIDFCAKQQCACG